ncbi:MAG: hypothetical protein AMXMBFR36_16300 [Acidobacteriota bacterium]
MSGESPLAEHFAELAGLPDDERAARLADLARTDPRLAAELGRLLAARGRGERLFDAPAISVPEGESEAPRRIDSYRIVREIGRGGMGRVFLAEQETEGWKRRVALKVLDSALPSEREIRRFREEVRILASLEHPGIARFLDGGRSEGGIWYLALEFVDGEDLIDYAESRGLATEARIRLFLDVLDAVRYAHEKNVVHRDLKPSNILVDATGHPRLLDFGISKLLAPDDSGEIRTKTDFVALTPAYASPEQLRGEPVGFSSDLYSLGILLYELTTGAHPHRHGSDPRGAVDRSTSAPDPPPPSAAIRASAGRSRQDTAPPLGRDFDAICMRAIRSDPAARYPSAADFAADLEALLAGRPISARRVSRVARLGRRLARRPERLVAALAVATTIGVGALWVTRDVRFPGAGRGGLGPTGADESVAFAPVASESAAAREEIDRGAAALAALDPFAALAGFERALELDPGSLAAWLGAARAADAAGDLARADRAAERGLELVSGGTGEAAAWFTARAAAARADWEGAADGFDRLFVERPERIDLGLDLARSHLRSGRLDRARTVLGRLRQIADARGGDARVAHAEAELLSLAREHQAALAAASRAAELALPFGADVIERAARRIRGESRAYLLSLAEARSELDGVAADARASGDRANELLARAARLALELRGGETEAEPVIGELEEIVEGLGQLGQTRAQVLALVAINQAEVYRGRFAFAERALARALDLARERDDPLGIAQALSARFVLEVRSGDYAAGFVAAREALPYFRASGDRIDLARTLAFLGDLELESLEIDDARAHIAEAETLARSLGDEDLMSDVLVVNGTLNALLGNTESARQSMLEAIGIAERRSDLRGVGAAAYYLAGYEIYGDRPGDVEVYARRAAEAYEKTGDTDGVLDCAPLLAWAAIRRGDAAEAERLLAELRTAIERDADSNQEISLIHAEALVAQATGDSATEAAQWRRLREWARENGIPRLELTTGLWEARALARSAAAPRDLEAVARPLLARAESKRLDYYVREFRALLDAGGPTAASGRG